MSLISNAMGEMTHELFAVVAKIGFIPPPTRESCQMIFNEVEIKKKTASSPSKRSRYRVMLSHIKQSQKAILFEIWTYLLDIMSLADEVWLEPVFPNRKRPDLVLVHQGRVYVIDVKTTAGYPWSVHDDILKKEFQQITDTAMHLIRKLPRNVAIYSFKLLFAYEPTHLYEPAWIDMLAEAIQQRSP